MNLRSHLKLTVAPLTVNASMDNHRWPVNGATDMRFPNAIIVEDAETLFARHGERLSPLRGAKILVTGASGFLCSYLVDVLATWNRHWSSSPVRIVAVDNFVSASRARVAHLCDNESVEFITHDVTGPILSNWQFDYIVHGASIASPVFYRRFPIETI